jgi:hypothetical protein
MKVPPPSVHEPVSTLNHFSIISGGLYHGKLKFPDGSLTTSVPHPRSFLITFELLKNTPTNLQGSIAPSSLRDFLLVPDRCVSVS